MAIDFPSSPTVGQIYTYGSSSWKWTGVYWNVEQGSGGGCTADTIPPPSPVVGQMWYDTTTGKTYIWYDSTWSEMFGSPTVADASSLSGSTLASNVTASSLTSVAGGNISPFNTKNRLVNGAMDIWQRGGGPFNGMAYNYGPDQWMHVRQGLAAGSFLYQVVNPAHGFQNWVRFGRDDGNTTTNVLYMTQNIPTEVATRLAGRQMILSFTCIKYNVSDPLGIRVRISTGTGTTGADIKGTFTSATSLIDTGVPLVAGMGRYTVGPVIIPANCRQLEIRFYMNPVGTASTDLVDMAGIQFEEGAVATPFEFAPYAAQLAECERFFQRVNPYGNNPSVGMGWAYNTTNAVIFYYPPTKFRAMPVATGTALELTDYNGLVGVNSVTVNAANNGNGAVLVECGAASAVLTPYRPYALRGNTGAAYFALSAEL